MNWDPWDKIRITHEPRNTLETYVSKYGGTLMRNGALRKIDVIEDLIEELEIEKAEIMLLLDV